MSNALAVAAVTATLHNLLTRVREPLWPDDNALSDAQVSLKPPDTARISEDHNQLNLFMYQVQQNGAFRNRDLPPRPPAIETGPPPLALNLFYLLTAYGRQGDELHAHRLLIGAMQLLHDNTLLTAPVIKAAAGMYESLAEQDLDQQLERVHITPHSLSLEEMSRLWGMFQGKYRTSVAYQVSVVLVHSTLSRTAAKPVETRAISVGSQLARSAPR